MSLEFKLRLSQKNYTLRTKPPSIFTLNKRKKKIQYSEKDRLFLQQQRENVMNSLDENEKNYIFYIRKRIPVDKTLCPISIEEIEINSKFQICSCQNCFKLEHITEWLSVHPTCPMCRTIWNTNTVYIRIH